MSRIDLVMSITDTLEWIKKNPYIARKTKEAVEGSRIYMENFESDKKGQKIGDGIIQVTCDSTFGEARKHAGGEKRVAVLNFANGTNPGGGARRGAVAQEECLCRSSNLLKIIENGRFKRDHYDYHEKNAYLESTDRLIYTKDVLVFKNEDLEPKMLERKDWFFTDVITCAAPILSGYAPTEKEELSRIFESRIRNILESAIDNEVDILILGAFGCGAFGNPPKLVAGVFRNLLCHDGYRKYFERIVFAVKTDPECPSRNFCAFRDVFEK